VVNQIIKTGTVQHTGRAYLGVTAVDASQVAAQNTQGGFGPGGLGQGGGFGFGGGNGNGLTPTTPSAPTVQGAYVEQVGSGSPAAQAGIQQGDIITAANGQPITGESDLLTALADGRPGAKMTLTINRNGSTVTVTATLGELPAAQ
jgi:S1-C subfamily serine protease